MVKRIMKLVQVYVLGSICAFLLAGCTEPATDDSDMGNITMNVEETDNDANTGEDAENITEENCKDASKFLTSSFYNKTIKDIFEHIDEYSNSFNNQIDSYQNLFNSLIQVLEGYVNNGMMMMPAMALIIVACIIWVHRSINKDLQEK